MAINIPIISDFTDAGIKNARLAFQKFRTEVGQAEGAMGKFKAGAGVALDAVKANAATFALGAGVAISKFAIDAAMKFKDLALQADAFSAATGIAVQDASRWIELTGDMGVPVDALEGAIGRLNKTIGGNPDVLKDLGDDAVYLDGGALDVNATFLNVIQRLKDIKDPADRAREGARLLGKGWQDMALLIDAGSENLKQSLAEVSDSKVIDPAEVERAKEFRDTMDDFKDKLEDAALSIGENVIPVLSTLVDWLGKVFEAAGFVRDYLVDVGEGGKTMTEAIGLGGKDLDNALRQAMEAATAAEEMTRVWKEGYGALVDAKRPLDDLTFSEEQAEDATWRLNDAWKNLLLTLDLESSFRDAKAAIDELDVAAAEAFADPTKFDAYKDQQDAVIRKFAEIIEQMQLTDAEQNRIKFLVDTEPLDYALEALNRINLAATGQIQTSLPRFGGARAEGGPVMAGTAYLVGERGPEIFMPSSSGTIIPNMSSNSNITVNVSGADPNAVVRALQQYVRQSGPVPVNTRTM